MAKKLKLQPAGELGGKSYFYTPEGKIVDAAGLEQEAGFIKRLGHLFVPFDPSFFKGTAAPVKETAASEAGNKKLSEYEKKYGRKNLMLFFPRLYESMEKFRKAYNEDRTKDIAETKRVQRSLDFKFGTLQDIMEDNTDLLKNQLSELERSTTLLSSIAEAMSDMQGGGFGLSIPGNPRGPKSKNSRGGQSNKRKVGLGKNISKTPAATKVKAPGLAGAVTSLVAIGSYFAYEYYNQKSSNTSQHLEPPAAPPPAPPAPAVTPPAAPKTETNKNTPAPAAATGTTIAEKNETAAVVAAKAKGANNNIIPKIEYNAKDISFKSDKLTFDVEKLVIDVNGSATQSLGGGGGATPGGGGGGGGGTGQAMAPVQTAQGVVKPDFVTPSSFGVTGGKSAYQGFTGTSPTKESVKQDLAKARSLQPSSGFVGTNPIGNDFYAAIMRAEGTTKHGNPYDTSLGYMKSPKPLTQMTMKESLEWGDKVRVAQGLNSSAKGAFQIVNATQRDAMKALGIGDDEPFDEKNQKRMADWIYKHQGLGAWEGFKVHPEEIAKANEAIKNGDTVKVTKAPIPSNLGSMFGDMTKGADLKAPDLAIKLKPKTDISEFEHMDSQAKPDEKPTKPAVAQKTTYSGSNFKTVAEEKAFHKMVNAVYSGELEPGYTTETGKLLQTAPTAPVPEQKNKVDASSLVDYGKSDEEYRKEYNLPAASTGKASKPQPKKPPVVSKPKDNITAPRPMALGANDEDVQYMLHLLRGLKTAGHALMETPRAN